VPVGEEGDRWGGGRSVGGERGARGPAAGLVVLGRPGEQEPL
jgi:hypothetical protein